MVHRQTGRRLGLSLLEVLTALGIFMLSAVVISQMVQSASRSALRSHKLTQASIHCEAKMEELAAGVLPLQSTGQQPLDGVDPGWYYAVDVEPEGWSVVTVDGQSVSGLNAVHVKVTWTGVQATEHVEYTMSRLILAPSLRVPEPDTVTTTNASGM